MSEKIDNGPGGIKAYYDQEHNQIVITAYSSGGSSGTLTEFVSFIKDLAYTVGWSANGVAGGLTVESDGPGVFVGAAVPGPIFDVERTDSDGTQGLDVDATSILIKSGPLDVYSAVQYIYDRVVDTYTFDAESVDESLRAYMDRYDQTNESMGDKIYNYSDNLHIQ